MLHTSAHKAEQEAVQEAYDRGTLDRTRDIRTWLKERSDMADFAVVLRAFDADWCEPVVEDRQ